MWQQFYGYFVFFLLSAGFSLSAEVIVNDFGDEDDFSSSSPIYLIREEWEGNYTIPGDESDFIHQETQTSFAVFTDAQEEEGLIRARVIRMTTCAEFRTDAVNEGNTVYIGIRYKDNLPVVYGAMPVYAHDGNDWVEIAAIGGQFDHAWKVAVVPVEPQHLAATEGEYRFRIGEGLWSRGLTGDLPLDRIELAGAQNELTVEVAVQGFYPVERDAAYTDVTRDSCWRVDGEAFFPIGFAAGWTGMSEDSWQEMADAGFNTVLFYNWMMISEPYAAGEVWETLASGGHYGFGEFLEKSADAGLKVIGVFQNDIKYAVVRNHFNSETATLDFITDVCTMHRDHSALLAWSPVDEPDHSDIPEFYAPLEWCMAIKDAIRKGDDTHPIYALEMGWRKGAFGHYKDIADFQGYDVYPQFGSSIAGIGERADLLVEETKGEKPFIAFLKAYDRTAAQAYMSFAEAYLALIHGAGGIFYWSYGGAEPIWDTLSKIANEITSLGNVVLPPARIVDVNGTHDICGNSNTDHIEQCYINGADDKAYILAINLLDEPVDGVTFTVDALTEGETVTVLFENRTLSSGDGLFQDDFPGYGRHVYQLATKARARERQRLTTPSQACINVVKNGSGISFVLDNGQSAPLRIFTPGGRLVATLHSITTKKGVMWQWNKDTAPGRKRVMNVLIVALPQKKGVIVRKFIF